MVGRKTMLTEGGNRHYLLVAGPGIPAGATDYSLTSIKDLMATTIALGGGGDGGAGDGVSIRCDAAQGLGSVPGTLLGQHNETK
jgi:hypothetical protein